MSCVSTPTATQFSGVVTSAVSTSFSEQVTTLSSSTSTNLITSCLSSADLSSGSSGVGSCVSSTVITSTTVIGGGVSTTSVPVEVTNVITSSVPTNTLFAPCTDTSTGSTSSSSTSQTTTPTSTSTSTSTSEPPSTQFSQSSTTVILTPTTTFTSSQPSTLSNGQITQIVVTLTSALPPTSSVQVSSVPVATTQSNDNGGGSSTALGAIIGGTLGGFVGLLAIIGAVWFFRRRRINFDEIFEKDYEEYTGKLQSPKRGRMLDLEDEPIIPPSEANVGPKPYVYGLVGSNHATSPTSLNAGLVAIPAGNSSRHSLQSHTRSSSTAPLMNNVPGSRSASPAGSNHSSHGGTGGGLSPSPSAATGGRSGSPGPLGVNIPTGPMFTEPFSSGGGGSPTSITGSRGPLRVANALDAESSPASPRPDSPATPPTNTNKRASTSMYNVASPSTLPTSEAGGTSKSPLNPSSSPVSRLGVGPPPAAYAYLAEKQQKGLQRNDTLHTVSSGSVYSQPSRAPTPPPGKALEVHNQTRSPNRER